MVLLQRKIFFSKDPEGSNIFQGRGSNFFQGVQMLRGTHICAHAWIFFKLCILMTLYTNYEDVFIQLDS